MANSNFNQQPARESVSTPSTCDTRPASAVPRLPISHQTNACPTNRCQWSANHAETSETYSTWFNDPQTSSRLLGLLISSKALDPTDLLTNLLPYRALQISWEGSFLTWCACWHTRATASDWQSTLGSLGDCWSSCMFLRLVVLLEVFRKPPFFFQFSWSQSTGLFSSQMAPRP